MTRRKLRPGNSAVAIAYIRVSTRAQELGPEAQRAQIEAWAAREGVQIAAWHVDQGVSGATPAAERPGLSAALASVQEHSAGVLVVAERSRLARDTIGAALIDRAVEDRGARVHAIGSAGNGTSDDDRMLRTIIDAVHERHRAAIRSKTREALAAKRARGEKTGGEAPYGYRLAADGVHLEPRADEQAVIARIRERRDAGLSVRAIASALAAEGIVGRTGRPLSHTQVHRIVRAA